MEGRAEAPAAVTLVNALATGSGAAVAIDRSVTARVELDDSGTLDGEVGSIPGEDPSTVDSTLIERCVALTVERYGDGQGGTVHTDSEVPVAAGLKSSSAAANATVLATLEALDVADEVDPLTACRLGVAAARDVGVTVTGAFDDASASMLGGVTVTDNDTNELLSTGGVDWDVLVWVPPKRAYSADADVAACRRVAPVASLAVDLAREGRYADAMNVNGLAYAAALDAPTDPLVEAYEYADAASLSGTGPAVAAVGPRTELNELRATWSQKEGRTWITTTRTTGARKK